MECKDPKVSIIIPVYNVEAYLGECLQSAISQSLEAIEIICVNDGSTDESLKIIEQYQLKDKRIRVITQGNKGASASRNKGMEQVAGKYIYFLDSDDSIEQEAMEKLYNVAEEQKAEVVYFNTRIIFDTEDLKREKQGYIDYYRRKSEYLGVKTGIAMADEIFRHADYIPSCVLQFFSHTFLEENHIRFLEGIIYEDNLFTLEVMLKAKRAVYVNEIYYNRRLRENSVSTLPISAKNYKGYCECMSGLQQMIDEFRKDLTEELEKNLGWLAGFFERRAKEVYDSLTLEEKQKADQYKVEKERKTGENG